MPYGLKNTVLVLSQLAWLFVGLISYVTFMNFANVVMLRHYGEYDTLLI